MRNDYYQQQSRRQESALVRAQNFAVREGVLKRFSSTVSTYLVHASGDTEREREKASRRILAGLRKTLPRYFS